MGDGRWEMEERRCVVNDGGERSDQSRLLGADFCVEPGAGVGPVTFGGALGNAQQRSGFSNGHANEVAEFDQVGFLFVFRSEFFKRVIDGQEVVIVLNHQLDIVQFDAPLAAAVAQGAFATGVVNEDAAHGFGRCREEMVPVLPFPALLPHQLEPGFVDQRGRLEDLAGRFTGHFVGCEPAQLRIDQRQQLVSGL